MRISARTIASFMIGAIIYFSLGGGAYFLGGRLNVIALGFTVILFFYGAILAGLNVRENDFNWSVWFFGPLVFAAYILIAPAITFSINTGVSPIPSIAAGRAFRLLLFAPALYFLYRVGYRVEDIERVFIITLVLVILSYVFHYFRMDLVAAYNSTDYLVNSLVVYDPWRGYRLIPPGKALSLTTVISTILIFKANSGFKKLLFLSVFLLCLWIWSLVLARAVTAALLFAVLAYHFFFARKPRLGIFFMALPVLLVLATYATMESMQALAKLDPEWDGVRYKSYGIALDVLKQYPIFGFGQQSYATITVQQIFWYKFYPSDIGIMGVGFEYGIVGMVLYLYFAITSVSKLVSTNWLYREKLGTTNPQMIAITVLFISWVPSLAMSPQMTGSAGLVCLALAISLCAIWRHKLVGTSSPVPTRQGLLSSTQPAV